MARAEILQHFILSWEGGFVNDKADKGGATNKGVTIATWKQQGYDNDHDGDKDVKDLKMMTGEQWMTIFKKNYWDRWKADEIESQSIANLLVDWTWCSGKWGIVLPQQLLSVKADGLVGTKTIAALNRQNPEELFDALQKIRVEYLGRIVKKCPRQGRFLNGWLRRVNAIEYGKLIKNSGEEITF